MPTEIPLCQVSVTNGSVGYGGICVKHPTQAAHRQGSSRTCGGREQRQRVEVGLAATQPPVQAGRHAGTRRGRRTACRSGSPRATCWPARHRRVHRLVRRPQAAGVVDAHHRPARHHARRTRPRRRPRRSTGDPGRRPGPRRGGRRRTGPGGGSNGRVTSRCAVQRRRPEGGGAGDGAGSAGRPAPGRRPRRARARSGTRTRARMRPTLGPSGAATEPVRGDLWTRRTAGENRAADLAYAYRCGPFRRVDFARPPPALAGQSPPRSRRATAGCVAPLGRQGGAPPGARVTTERARPPAARTQKAPWQSSA